MLVDVAPKDITVGQGGFDLYVEKIAALTDGATADDVAGIGDVTDEERRSSTRWRTTSIELPGGLRAAQTTSGG